MHSTAIAAYQMRTKQGCGSGWSWIRLEKKPDPKPSLSWGEKLDPDPTLKKLDPKLKKKQPEFDLIKFHLNFFLKIKS